MHTGHTHNTWITEKPPRKALEFKKGCKVKMQACSLYCPIETNGFKLIFFKSTWFAKIQEVQLHI